MIDMMKKTKRKKYLSRHALDGFLHNLGHLGNLLVLLFSVLLDFSFLFGGNLLLGRVPSLFFFGGARHKDKRIENQKSLGGEIVWVGGRQQTRGEERREKSLERSSCGRYIQK